MSSREDFEAWAKRYFWEGPYADGVEHREIAWASYQAAQSSAVRKCADACINSFGSPSKTVSGFDAVHANGIRAGRQEAADAIRRFFPEVFEGEAG